jgi:DNA-binding NtrC family response regulator
MTAIIKQEPIDDSPIADSPVKQLAKPKIEDIKDTETILVIEDEREVMVVTQMLLKRLGYNSLGAKTGQEALDVIKTFDGTIDLAMLDLHLPDMGGNIIYPFLMQARPDLKVIICSGRPMDRMVQDIMKAGAEDFIQKPFTMASLFEKLKNLLRGDKKISI